MRAPDGGSPSGGRVVNDVLVLCYHAISPTWTAGLSVTPEALKAQLTTLVRAGWRGATFSDAVTRTPWRRTLAVTFDDAFASVLDRAYPILTDLGLPATAFAPTAFISDDRGRLEWPGIDMWTRTGSGSELVSMSWDELRFLAAQGWEIGSHTRTHPHLTELDDETLRRELEGSRQECSAGLGAPCETLAYPYGDVDARVAEAAAAAGYAAAAALSSSLRPSGPHRWPRVGVYHDDHMLRFRLKIDRTVRRIRATRMWPPAQPFARA
ncbi:MAG TPA: polysaccharide deacetylase family protein [Solirubrobacteraceae bacterium]|nr:polysaccharide deacetylase family protein [Solirubrobacteraceae bacterium]